MIDHKPPRPMRPMRPQRRPTPARDIPGMVVLAVASLLALLASASCGTGNSLADAGNTSAEPDSATVDDGTLRIGSVASLTGSAEPYGASQQRGTELAVARETVPGDDRNIDLLPLDDRSDPQTGAGAFSELIAQGVSVILGPTLSPVAEVADPLAQSVGVPVLAVTNTTLDIGAIGDGVWRVTLSESRMLPQGIAAIQDLKGVTTAALVYDTSDDYSRGAAAAFREGASAQGLELVAEVGFDAGADPGPDYGQVLTNAAESGADALLFAARSTPAVELLRAAEALGTPQVLLGSNGFNAPEVLDAAGSASEGLIVAAAWNPDLDEPASKAFVDAYQERHGTEPDAFAASAYAGVQVLLAAVAASDRTSRQAIQQGLASLEEVDTVVGRVRFEANEAVYPAAIQQVRDGRLGLVARGSP